MPCSATDEVRKRLAFEGGEPVPGAPEEYAADIDREEARWSKLVAAIASGENEADGDVIPPREPCGVRGARAHAVTAWAQPHRSAITQLVDPATAAQRACTMDDREMLLGFDHVAELGPGQLAIDVPQQQRVAVGASLWRPERCRRSLPPAAGFTRPTFWAERGD